MKAAYFPQFDLDVPAVCLMSGRMSPNLNPKTLDDLLANARHYAEYCMRGTGNLPPTLFLIGSDGKQVMFMPKNLADVKAKNDFAAMSQLMAIASGAAVAVLALEAWMKAAKPGETLDTTEPPSEAFDREEVIVLMGESMTEGRKQQMLPIIRSDNHKFFGLAGTIQLERVSTVWRACGDETKSRTRTSTGGGPNGAPAN